MGWPYSITKGTTMETLSAQETVGRLVAARPARSAVFERYGIDYCCGGKRPLQEVCGEKHLSVDDVVRALLHCDAETPADGTDWTAAPLGELADHIVATHHEYLREALPRLTALTEKVARAHGERRAELVEVARIFAALREELEAHTWKEEQILFPLVKRLEEAATPVQSHCGSVNNPIRVMEMEHDSAGQALERLRALTAGYVAPADACNTYRAMLAALEELEADLHRHIHKENSILFPRAAAREAELNR